MNLKIPVYELTMMMWCVFFLKKEKKTPFRWNFFYWSLLSSANAILYFINTSAFMTTWKINKIQNFVQLKGGDLRITVPSQKEGEDMTVFSVV